MTTLWDKGGETDAAVAAFTVWDDREIDQHLATQDVLGSLAHLKVLEAAELMSTADAQALRTQLQALFAQAEAGQLKPGPGDEDIHSTVERLLTDELGDPGKRIHTARSRNDQVATDVALWAREQAVAAHGDILALADATRRFAGEWRDAPLPGMTHLQPAMPSSFGLWAAGYSALFLDDAALMRSAFDAWDACPLGSAAGYGVPEALAPIDRSISASSLAFSRVLEPVTAVQGGRGKPESTLLFACTQAVTSCARLARDIVLYVHPNFGWLKLPDAFTTGSSIMPQKKNPDVAELIRGHLHGVRSALNEVMGLAGSLPGGYHRDFQLLKAPLIRGVRAARACVQLMTRIFRDGLSVNPEKAATDSTPELFATHRALELVVSGVPFRDAYKQVAAEVESGDFQVPENTAVTPVAPALAQLESRRAEPGVWQDTVSHRIINAYKNLLNRGEQDPLDFGGLP